MTSQQTAVPIIILLAASSLLAQATKRNPCVSSADSETSRWRVYADPKHQFCFRYPQSYEAIASPQKVCNKPKLHAKRTGGDIYVCASGGKFDLSAMAGKGPTGIEDPPQPIQAGRNTFYYWGPGGGGVSYADQYYFDLHGKELSIVFDGPYENDKTPTAETKKMELQMLRSFREF